MSKDLKKGGEEKGLSSKNTTAVQTRKNSVTKFKINIADFNDKSMEEDSD